MLNYFKHLKRIIGSASIQFIDDNHHRRWVGTIGSLDKRSESVAESLHGLLTPFFTAPEFINGVLSLAIQSLCGGVT